MKGKTQILAGVSLFGIVPAPPVFGQTAPHAAARAYPRARHVRFTGMPRTFGFSFSAQF